MTTPLHAKTHPSLDVEGCFGCKAAGVSLYVPNYMSSKTQPGGMSGIEANHALRKDLEKAQRNDKEGRLVRASRT